MATDSINYCSLFQTNVKFRCTLTSSHRLVKPEQHLLTLFTTFENLTVLQQFQIASMVSMDMLRDHGIHV